MTSGFYQYAKILTNSTNYAKRMTRLSARIFGEMARPTEPTSFKVNTGQIRVLVIEKDRIARQFHINMPSESDFRKNRYVVKLLSAEPLDQRHDFVHYYPKHKEIHILMRTLRSYGLFRDEHEDFKDEMKRLRQLRGKGPPKKGEGKRSKTKELQ